jgi:hypothetical protein
VLPSRRADDDHLALSKLMPPPPPPPLALVRRKRARAAELPNEYYAAALDAIIERDFFPDLPRLRLQLDWLDAVASGDATRMMSVRGAVAASIRGAAAPVGATPAGGYRAARDLFSARGDETPRIHAGRTRADRACGDDDDAASMVSWSAGIGAAPPPPAGPADDVINRTLTKV